jgi:hypothetical protein
MKQTIYANKPGGALMDNIFNSQGANKKNFNPSIGCNVFECKFHSNSGNFCSLDHILVSHHVEPAEENESTDCASFYPRNE